jgi:flagellar biosynthesis/type III secretory pathway protein FliH
MTEAQRIYVEEYKDSYENTGYRNGFLDGFDRGKIEENASLREEIERLKKERDDLESVAKEVTRFIPSLLTCVQKDFQYPDNCIKALEDLGKATLTP